MNKSYRIKKTWILYPAVIVFIGIVVFFVWFRCFQPVTTVLIVRHAEKSTQPYSDPPLSALGLVRAQKLVHVAGEAGITGIFATQFVRTRQTVEPLAEYLGLTIDEFGAHDIEGLVNYIKTNHSGEVVIVAGHSDTVPLIIQEFGGDPIPPIYLDQYDNLYVVTLSRYRSTRILHLKYGNQS